ncbi:MAG: zf-HC2 domain-containing protein [Acidimicrobiales bacterium]
MTLQPCDRWQEAISAMVDGEDGGVDPALVDAHVAACPRCQRFRADAEQLRRLSRVRPAAAMPDLSGRITKTVRANERAGAWLYVRVALVVVALQITALSLREMWRLADGHEGRHVFAFSLTYAVALVLVAWRPARARTVLPISAALAASLLVTAVADTIRGNTAWLGEFVHLPEFVSVPLVWLLARPHRLRPDQPAGSRIRLVHDADAPADAGTDGGAGPAGGDSQTA